MSPEFRILRGVSSQTYRKILTDERHPTQTCVVKPKRMTEKIGNILKLKK